MLDTESIYKVAWQQAATELGYTLDDPFYLSLVGLRTADSDRGLFRRFGEGFPMEPFRSRWSELWLRRATDSGIPRKPGLDALLAFLDERRLPVAIATSSDRERTVLTLRCAGLRDRFPVVVTGDQVPRGKPAPDIYLESARRLGVDPTRCAALEDSDAGILAASGAGMLALLIPDLKLPSPQAVASAFRVLRSLDEARELMTDVLENGMSFGG